MIWIDGTIVLKLWTRGVQSTMSSLISLKKKKKKCYLSFIDNFDFTKYHLKTILFCMYFLPIMKHTQILSTCIKISDIVYS
jgi:hypothetical protein